MREEVLAAAGSLDVWVNSAYPKAAGAARDLEEVSPEAWRADVDVHLNGYGFCCREAARAMRCGNRRINHQLGVNVRHRRPRFLDL